MSKGTKSANCGAFGRTGEFSPMDGMRAGKVSSVHDAPLRDASHVPAQTLERQSLQSVPLTGRVRLFPPILQMKHLQLRGVRQRSQGHRAIKEQYKLKARPLGL